MRYTTKLLCKSKVISLPPIIFFDKAKKSTKSNYVVDKMKRGKFMLNNDGQLLFLPEHETYGKSSGDLLTEHWL